MILSRAIGSALETSLRQDERVILVGEDISDPYGGAFKVTRGLSTAFPGRVRNTPISEAAIAGISAGLALSGRRPITEIMFGDFMTLAFDQVVNHITKYEAMYDGQVTCPVVLRMPVGGHRGYGPTHSQSLEKHLLGVPHLRTVAASTFHDPTRTFAHFLEHDSPVVHVEHKLLYPSSMRVPADGRSGRLLGRESASTAGALPTVTVSAVPTARCRATVVAYGYTADLAAQVVEELAVHDEVFAELVVPTQLSPLDMDPVFDSVGITRRLVTLEEGTAGWSWGTEIAARVDREFFGLLRAPTDVVASEPTVIPTARDAEARVLLGVDRVRAAVLAAARD